MDRKEKKHLRDLISEHLDLSHTRLTDEDALELKDIIDNYDADFKGKSSSRNSSFDDFSSDGKYTRHESRTDTFTDEIGVQHDYSYYDDDDGQNDKSTYTTQDPRDILNLARIVKRTK